MNAKTKKMSTMAMLCAISYIVLLFIRIPVILFLDYEPKDIIIAIGGFIYGPMEAFIITVVVSVVEMITISSTGIIGCIMNIIASCGFACTASYIYKKNRTLKGAVIGLISGVLMMTGLMILWNYLFTPIYMGYQRSVVAKMLIPTFLPFNLLKGSINATIAMFVYKPIVRALRKSQLINDDEKQEITTSRIGIMLVCGLILATCIFGFLVLNHKI